MKQLLLLWKTTKQKCKTQGKDGKRTERDKIVLSELRQKRKKENQQQQQQNKKDMRMNIQANRHCGKHKKK